MANVNVSSKGQLVLPAELRRKMGIKGATRVVIYEENGRLIIQTMKDLLRELRGSLQGPGLDPMKVLLEERKRDRFL